MQKHEDLKFREVKKNKKTGKITFDYTDLLEVWSEDSWQGALPYVALGVDEYSGTKDINDVELYEGDLILFCDGGVDGKTVHEIKKTKGCCWNVWNKSGINCSLAHAVYDHEIKKVGNTHEKPEKKEVSI